MNESNRISILFPFRSDDEWRNRLFEAVLERYHYLYPDFEVCVGSNNDEPFSRSSARNDAFEKSTGDILILNDADTFCTGESLAEAIRLVESGEPFVLPYSVYFNLNEEWTRDFLAGDPAIALPLEVPESGYIHRLATAESGVLVVSRSAWQAAGGWDERFIDYGWEDRAFVAALNHACGRGLKLHGTAYHLDHPLTHDPFQHPWKEHNRALFEQYPRYEWRRPNGV